MLRSRSDSSSVHTLVPSLSRQPHQANPAQFHRSPDPPAECKQDPPHYRVSHISERPQSLLTLILRSLTSAVVEEAISTRTAAVISYHPPIFKPLSSFTLVTPLQKSLLLCAAQGISVFSPHTALDSVKGGINDWLSAIVQTAAPGSVEYVGAPKEDDLGGEGRLVRFEQPVGLDSLVNAIKKGLALSSGTCPTNSYAAVTYLCRHPESPTWPLASPTFRRRHISGYMRWKWRLYAARR